MQAHIEVGRALAPLRQEGIMIIGSGSSFHNLQDFMRGGMSMTVADESKEKSEVSNPQAPSPLLNSRLCALPGMTLFQRCPDAGFQIKLLRTCIVKRA